MSHDLHDQLRAYGADHDESQRPVAASEVMTRTAAIGSDATDRGRRPTPFRRVLLVAAAVLVVVAGGVALLVRGDEPTRVTTVDTTPDTVDAEAPPITDAATSVAPPQSTSPSTTAATATSGPTTTAPELPTVPARTYQSSGVSVAAPQPPSIGVSTALGAWGDGFVHVAISGGSRVIPELTAEQNALFPDEIFDEFGPDGLAGVDVGAATGALYDVGLLDQVIEVLDANPELRDLVENGGPIAEVMFTADYTVDGSAWERLAANPPPVSQPQGVAVVGDRVVAVGRDPSLGGAVTVVVASTTDLQVWETQSFDANVDRVAMAMNPSGWIGGRMGDEEMVVLEPTTHAARWGETPVAVGDRDGPEGGVIALTDGFLRQGRSISHSPDGLTWTLVTEAPEGIQVQGSLPLDDGSDVVLAWTTRCESQAYRVSENATRWERVDSDDIPSARTRGGGLETWASSLTSAAVAADHPYVSTWVYEQEDLRLVVGQCFPFAWYELSSISTGEPLVSEWVDHGRASEPLATELDHLTVRYADGFPFTLVDPDSGRTLLSGNLMDGDYDGDDPISSGSGQPSYQLIATTDGSTWLITEVPEGDRVHIAARNGNTILLRLADETWQRYDMQPVD